MSKLNLDGWEAGVLTMRQKVYGGVRQTAEDAHGMAQARAPVRKAFRSKRASTSDLADFHMKLGRNRGSLTGGEIREAAGHLGIELPSNYQVAQPMGIGTSRSALSPNNLSFQRTKRSKITGRDLRELTPTRSISGRMLSGGTFNTGRLRRQGVVLFGRAKREARRGTGVITSGGRRQYGGFLRKNIVIVESDEVGLRIVITIKSKAPYSRYVEFPTSRTAAQPFLLPALKAQRNKLAGNIQKAKR